MDANTVIRPEQRSQVVRAWGKRTVEQRFLSKIVSDEIDCWQWQGAKEKNGYGKFTVGKVTMTAHRFAFDRFRGAIPNHLTCDHLCRNTSCVNPWHIELVTMRENLLRGNTFQARNAAKRHCPKGHPYSGDNLYHIPTGGRGCKTCRREQNKRQKKDGQWSQII